MWVGRLASLYQLSGESHTTRASYASLTAFTYDRSAFARHRVEMEARREREEKRKGKRDGGRERERRSGPRPAHARALSTSRFHTPRVVSLRLNELHT